jgi:hypothetical protein
MFLYPVTENEVESVTQSLQGNSSAGFNEILLFLIKHHFSCLGEVPALPVSMLLSFSPD